MVLCQNRRAVGTFSNRIDAEQALIELINAGFPLAQICVLAKDAEGDNQFGGAGTPYAFGDTQATTPNCASITASMLGAIGGCLVGLGIVAVPGVGPILALGSSGTALTTVLAGAGIGIASGGLISALAGVATVSDQAIDSDRFSPGGYLVMVDGTDDDVHRAESILKQVVLN